MTAAAVIAALLLGACGGPGQQQRILVFTKTAGFRHDSIPAGIAAIQMMGAEYGWEVHCTEDAARFTAEELAACAAVVFLNTSGDVLDEGQQRRFEDYVQGGGGFVGVHAATDTEYQWPWYGRLVGARFAGHPQVQEAVVDVVVQDHASTRHLPARWRRTDEWYNFTAPPAADVTILARLDETTYQGGTMPEDHPIAWCHQFDGGRAWYTAGGHTTQSYAEPDFLEHLRGGIEWAMGR